jgi:methylase of polypeptide subunit release factors
MAARPRHEALRGHVTELLRAAFDAPYEEIEHERYLLDGSGRVDTLWGATVIELKSDLRREEADVLARMPDYLRDAAARARSPRPVTGIATDGATFVAYQLRGATLAELTRHQTDPDRPADLLAWLEPLLTDTPDLAPEARAVAQAFGRASIAFNTARLALESLWAALGTHPEVRLKRDLWDGLLREAYGAEVGEDALFLQHTYLAIVVKAIAARVLGLPVDDPASLLSGRAIAEEGILGAVEADFFDWPLLSPEGHDLVRRVAAQAARFRLAEVETDVLKILYESLVDPDQRHDLGEYYTPDWLAFRVVEAAVDRPLESRVLDPACGSGTFLFHALRRLLAAGRAAGWSEARILAEAAERVRGLDVHPVAVTLARVTWLLALGPVLGARGARLTVPVFLGDAMQWSLRRTLDSADIMQEVPGDPPAPPLGIPTGFAEDSELFDRGLEVLDAGLRGGRSVAAVGRSLAALEGAAPADAARMAETYGQLRALYEAGRDGIWIFVFRNLVRPVWLSRPDQRADVLVGNPPWIVYRHLSAKMKDRLREGLSDYSLWVGGNLATQQDICALFWARGAERYLRPGGRIAFVLPFALLNAPVFAPLRAGVMGKVQTRLTGAWALERVWPIFGAQSGSSTTSTCVLFGERAAAAPPPAELDRWVGRLARRDATDAEASMVLQRSRAPWPRPRTLVGASPYRARFRQGATIVPRRFFIVDPEPETRLGRNRNAPRMRGRAGALDKEPWSKLEPPRGPVEAQFLRPLALGESVAPFRMLETVTAVIPMAGSDVLNAAAAGEAGHNHLGRWLTYVEAKWAEHANKGTDGQPRMTLRQQIDHMRKLSSQAAFPDLRVLYTKAGNWISATILADRTAAIDHMAYWAAARSLEEARYLLAILNSRAVLEKIKDLQPHGEATPRHFDNLVWTLPIPEYDPAEPLHRDLAAAAARAEEVAAAVPLPEAAHFTAKRRAIRAALAEDGIAAEIEALVDALLPP